jgi:hypothetical protein
VVSVDKVTDKVLLINTLVLPYLVDKTISLSTRIPIRSTNISFGLDENLDELHVVCLCHYVDYSVLVLRRKRDGASEV